MSLLPTSEIPVIRAVCQIAFLLTMALLAQVHAAASEPKSVALSGPVAVGEEDFNQFDKAQAELGRLLFYDPILSGNRNISCGTCHHHALAGTDALALGIGEGGTGIGTNRVAVDGKGRIKRRMSRNSPALFNLGAREVQVLFHDGRVSEDNLYENRFNTPAEEFLPQGLTSILAAQSLFPLIGEIEMAGAPEENEVSAAVNERIDYGWPLIVERIRGVPEYEPLFIQAFEEVDSFQNLKIAHIANAIGSFVGLEWQSFDSPYDEYLAGDKSALTPAQETGMRLFFGKAGCASCHGGPFLTDHDFHALGIPPLGPGRTRKFDLHARDVGRMGETDRLSDAYRFRTPSLRNVTLTAPYGHNGAYKNLEGIIRHHLDPLAGLDSWQPKQTVLPDVPWLNDLDFIVHQDRLEMARLRRHVDIELVGITDREIHELIAFLNALTGRRSVDGRLGRPDSVPSGLPVD